jgi:hypothetical protein
MMIKFILFLLVNGAIINTSDATMDVVSAEDINQSVAEQEKKIHSRLEAIEKQSVDDLLEIKNQKTLLLKLKQEKDNAAAALVETQAKLKAQTEAMQKIKQEKDIAAATLVETQATLVAITILIFVLFVLLAVWLITKTKENQRNNQKRHAPITISSRAIIA